MELKEYLIILKKYLFFIAILAFVGAIFAYYFAASRPQGYSTNQTFYLAGPKIEDNSNYTYEGYFAQEKARSFTDTAVAILDSSDFKSTVISPGQSLTVRKLAPQVIRLTANSSTPEAAHQLVGAGASAFNTQFITLAGDQGALSLKAIGQPPPAESDRLNRRIITISGALAGAAFALLVISLKVYFKV